MNELWEEFKKEAEMDLDSLVPKDSLKRSFWSGLQLKKSVKEKLLQIANDFFKSLKLPTNVVLKDITITGSIASYNWSKYSDIDLHLIIDFSEIDDNEELVKEYFGGKIFIWNNKHNIRINDHEVEIYVQNASEPHIAAGVFSLLNNEWIVEPERAEYDIDLETTNKKAKQKIDQIERIYDLFESREYSKAMAAAKNLKDRIKEMRRSGLSKEGVYAPENMAFKVLRRTGYLGLLHEIINKSYDKIMSLHKDLQGSIKVFIGNMEEEDESYDSINEEEKYQRRLKQRHYIKKKWLLGYGKQKNVSPYIKKPSYKRSKSAPAGFGGT